LGHTIIGVFPDSGDADLAAAHLREEFALEAGELDVVGQAEWDELSFPAEGDPGQWVVNALTAGGLKTPLGDEDSIGKRWGDRVIHGDTLVVARTHDPDVAQAIAEEFHHLGAAHVDLLPH